MKRFFSYGMTVKLSETDPFVAKAVNVWGVLGIAPIEAYFIPTHVVCQDEYDIGSRARYVCCLRCTEYKQGRR